jgi:predicted ATPase/class 3 adenylate cyclase
MEVGLPNEHIGPYRLAERLGTGGMGEVYRAYDERLDRWVALKRVSPAGSRDATWRERLRREARASARLNHPGIVQVFDLVQANDADCIVMELVTGQPLSRLLYDAPLDLARALALAREIAEALAEAHAHGIVHRDLKAENVLVTPAGHAKILDFGISKRLDPAGDEASLTSAGSVIGTLRTMAPEQACGGEVDHRADLFSFGVLIYEMVAGCSPFLGPNAAATVHRICREPHDSIRKHAPHVPETLASLVDRLLQKTPAHRFQSANEVAAALATLAEGLSLGRSEAGSSAWVTSTVSEPAPAPRLTGHTGSTAERRQVTVLSYGLVSADGGSLDPEEILACVPALRAVATEAAQRFDGQPAARWSHDGRIYFGLLRAHEDDACRAVRTALDIIARTSRGDVPGGAAVRIGIHTGSMVVSRTAPAQGEEPAQGDAPGVAVMLQSLAGPSMILVSESTLRLVESYFTCAEVVPTVPATGPQPLRTYRVIADRGIHSPVQGDRRLTPLVAREEELLWLLDRWTLAREGRGQVVLLSGEAGLGKSRLVWELRQAVTADGASWIEGHGSPFHTDSPLYPLIQWLQHWIGADDLDAPAVRLERLAATLSHHGLPLAEMLPVLAALLSLPASPLYPLPPLSPEAQRRKTLEALLSALLAAAERRPLLLVVEDLHWLDPTTIELLGLLVPQTVTVPLLLVLTFRPEFRPPWEERSSVTRLSLGLLNRSQAALMIDRLTLGDRLTPALREQIVARTDGVPLFVEEMTKMVLDAGIAAGGESPGEATGLQASHEVPSTLEGWLMARLDRLGTAKDLAQLAAVLGREFSHEVLREVAPWSEEELNRELDRLVEAEVIFRRGLRPRVQYLFKHALLQDAAYASLLRRDRRKHHQRIAEVLVERFPGIVENQPELVARHFAEAGLLAQAVQLGIRAGDQAIQAFAYREAQGQIERTLCLLRELPASPERDEQEARLQVALGVAKAHTRGPFSPEVLDAYRRASELCRPTKDNRWLFPALRGIYVHHLILGHAKKAVELSCQLLDLAEREGSPDLHRTALQSMGFSLLNTGDLVPARGFLETMLTLAGGKRSAEDPALPGAGDPLLEGMANLTWVLWLLGYPDQACKLSREALAIAREVSVPAAAGYVCFFSAELHALRGEPAEVLPLAQKLASSDSDQSFRAYQLIGQFLLGWVAAEQGETTTGIATMREVLTARQAHGLIAGIMTPISFLVAHLLHAGHWQEGLATVERGLALSAEGGHSYMDAELHRLQGELLLKLGEAEDKAEEQFHRALAVARRQGALSLELRAAVSLAGLWSRQNRGAEARALLASVYGGFREGFDTRDLQEARSLLAKLP